MRDAMEHPAGSAAAVAERRRAPGLPAGAPARLPARRLVVGLLLALVGLPLETAALTGLRGQVDLTGVLLLYLLLVVLVAVVGGFLAAAAAAVAAFLLANWYFTPPFHHFRIAKQADLLALVVFIAVAGVVSALVDLAARRAAEAARARAEAEALARLGGTLLHGQDPLPELVEQLRATFGQESVALLRRDRQGWRVEAVAGDRAPIRPEYASDAVELDPQTTLALVGRRLSGDDRRVLRAFTDQLAVALESRQLSRAAAEAALLAEANQLRTALLAAVSHDLRTPLASIKTAVTGLLQDDVTLPPEATAELLATIDQQTDRLDRLVGNLLDMSRLQAGALSLHARPVGLEEVVPAALASLADHGRGVQVEVPETLPRVHADPGLLERAIANLVANALAWSPPDRRVQVTAARRGDQVELCAIDHGPGVPASDRDRLFQPFQRLGDAAGGGVGLGLAVARGFVDAMHGQILPEDTPGGGLTMRVRLPIADGPTGQGADR
jgi:two-component system, OmpR family, sensor histidine kinase KdpD